VRTTSRRSTSSLFKDVAWEFVQVCMAPEQQLATALARGDPARGSIVRNALRGKLQELITR
jgi:hypothetical protein